MGNTTKGTNMITDKLKREAQANKDETGNAYGHAVRMVEGKEVKCVLNVLGKFVFFVDGKRTAAAKV